MEQQDELQGLVFDIGSGHTKCGFSGDDAPRVDLPTCLGQFKKMNVLQLGEYVGSDALSKRGILNISHPIQRGSITNFDHLQKIFAHCFKNELRVDPMDHPLLIADSPVNTVEGREKIMEILFESFGVPALYFSVQGVMAMQSSGIVSGTVLDSGKELTYALPIYEGKPIRNALQTIPFGGGDLTRSLYSLLLESGYQSYTAAEREIAGDAKRKVCYVAQNYEKELTEPKTEEYELPDGTIMNVSTLRIKATELMFQPQFMDLDFVGVHELVNSSIRSSDIDMRKDLFKNIVVCGGNTMFPGFIERFNREFSNLIPSSVECKVSEKPTRKYSSWIGGSIFSSMSTFREVWLDRHEYEDFGKNVSRFL